MNEEVVWSSDIREFRVEIFSEDREWSCFEEFHEVEDAIAAAKIHNRRGYRSRVVKVAI